MEFEFDVYGKVRGQVRPRTNFRNGHVYKSRPDREWEDAIKAAYINGNGPHFGDKPLGMYVTVCRELPKSRPKRIRREPDTHKPDGSNILKSIEDALNGIAYFDDKQLVDEHVRKMPRTREICERIHVRIVEVDE